MNIISLLAIISLLPFLSRFFSVLCCLVPLHDTIEECLSLLLWLSLSWTNILHTVCNNPPTYSWQINRLYCPLVLLWNAVTSEFNYLLPCDCCFAYLSSATAQVSTKFFGLLLLYTNKCNLHHSARWCCSFSLLN